MVAKQVAVVGAGIAGLGAAWRLAQRGFQVSLFEREQRPGGRARPVVRKNFTIERAGAIVSAADRALLGWIGDGSIRFQSDIQEGLEKAPEAFLRLFSGANLGKQLLAIT